MCANPFKKPKLPKIETKTVPQKDDRLADQAAEQELRRLRAQSGRAATLLTAGLDKLGAAPIARNDLLGS